MKVAIIGASGGLGRSIAYAEAKRGNDLFLYSTDVRDLRALKSDIEIRLSVGVAICPINFADLNDLSKLTLEADRYHFPIGLSLDEDILTVDEGCSLRLLQVNFISIALSISRLIGAKGDRSLDIFGYGSIAQARGRGRNIYYSAAKRALTSYFESLLHAKNNYKVRAYLIQLGYMKSQLSLGKKLMFRSIEPDEVARQAIRLADAGRTGIIFLPGFWRYICLILEILPWSIYRKLKF